MEESNAVTSATEAGVTEVNATVIKGQRVIESATIEGSDEVTSPTEAGVTEVNATVIKGQQVIESATMEGSDEVTSPTEAGVTEVNATVIKGQQVIESATMEGSDAVTSATQAGLTEVNATVIKGQQVIESATMEGCDAVTSATEAGVTEVNATVIKGQQVIESATMEGSDAVTSATEAGVTEINATVIKGQQVIESATMEGSDAVTSATQAGVTEVNATVIKGQQVIESATIEGSDAVTSATEAGVTEVNATVIKGQQVIESVTVNGRDDINSATESGVTEVNAEVIKGQQVIESATMEGFDAVTIATRAGVAEVNATVIKGQHVIEWAIIESRDDINCSTEAGVKEVNATVIKGQHVIQSAAMEGREDINSATDSGVKEVTATTIKGKDVIELTTTEGRDNINSAREAGVTELYIQAKTHESELQSICDKLKADLTGNNTQQEEEDFARQCNDLLRRLIDHYRDSVICVPLSTLNPSLDIRIQDIYANPKIRRMKIEKDGKHVKQEQIYKYIDCFCGEVKRIYLQGEPGNGKSYFAAKLVHDWCNVNAPIQAPIVKSTKEQMMFGDFDTLQKFRFLFFISLRDSREQTYVSQMIKTQLIYKIYAEDEWESAYKLVLKIMKNVMFLIIQDGLDEWPCKEALPSMDGIPKDHYIVITTSRPWKLADERIRNSQIDILFDLEGISDPKEFNERILRCLLDESTDIKNSVELFEEFLRSRNLESISSSPMLNTLVLSTWVDNRAERLTGSSLCELYTTLLENLCKKANSHIGYFDRYHPSTVHCFLRTKYVKPNMEHIDCIAKAAFSFLFSNEKESSLVFSDIDLSTHLSETAKQFALDSGLISKRKGKKCTDQTLSFVHKTIQEFLTAFHIHKNADVIDDVIFRYLKRHDNSYHDISQMFIFLCGFDITAANKLSTLMNELDVYSDNDHYFQDCILSGYKEAVANKNTPIHLHLSRFCFTLERAKDLMHIWTLNTSRARSLRFVWFDPDGYATIRLQDASTADCQGPGPVSLPAREDPLPSTQDDEEENLSSKFVIEFDLSLCHNLERLDLDGITVQPQALVGFKKLRYLHISIDCKCEALDLSHLQHIESIDLHQNVTLLPLSINNYKTLRYITLLTTYDGLDLSLFENLVSIKISNKVKVLQKPLLIHKQLTDIGFCNFDFNSLNNEAINTWCLLNGADPVQCADYTPVLPSIHDIILRNVTCSSHLLRSLLSTMLTLDHKVECNLDDCKITLLDHEVKNTLRGSGMSSCVGDADSDMSSCEEDADSDMSSCEEDEDSDMSSCEEDEDSDMSSCEEDEVSWFYLGGPLQIKTDLNNTCTFTFPQFSPRDCPGLWDTLHGQHIKCLNIMKELKCVGQGIWVKHVSSLSRSLASLSQLETLSMHLAEYNDVQLPLSLRHLTLIYETLTPSELRHLVNKLCAFTHTIECKLEFFCGNTLAACCWGVERVQPEEYIRIQQDLEALECVQVKRFRMYDRKPNTSTWCSDAWSVRGSVVDVDDNSDDIDEAMLCVRCPLRRPGDDILNRISMRLQINCC